MTSPRRAMAWAILLFAASAVCAEDDHVIDEPAAPPSQSDPQQHLIDLGANFDANLFEQPGNGWVLRGGDNIVVNQQLFLGNGRRINVPRLAAAEERPPESPTFARARALGAKRLERITASCELTAEQQRRLCLAMESDIRRFAVAVDAVRARYAGMKVNLNDQEGQKKWQQFQQDVQQCRNDLRRLFDSGSLFAATVPSTLGPEQVAGIEAELKARRTFRWRAMVVSTLAKMDDMLGLTQEQHDLLERTLLAKEPRLRTDELSPEQENAHLQQNLVYMVLAGTESGPLKKATSERQWRTLSLLMNQGKSMRSWIEQQGILEPEASGSDASRTRRAPRGPQ